MVNKPDAPLDPDAIRRKHLEQSIQKTLDLIKEYEDKRRLTREPLEIAACEKDIKRLKRELAAFQKEYAALTAGSVKRAGRRVVSSFPDDWLAGLPYPIAVACADFNRATQTADRFAALDCMLAATVKYMAVVALAQFRSDEPGSPRLAPWLERLSRRRLSEWIALVTEVGAAYDAQAARRPLIIAAFYDPYRRTVTSDSALARMDAEISQFMRDEAKTGPLTTARCLERLIAYRELAWEAHPEHLSVTFRKTLLALIQPMLRELLDWLSFLRYYPLRFTEGVHTADGGWVYEMEDWSGPSEGNPCPLCNVTGAGTQPPYKVRRLYLCTSAGQPLLNIYPLLIRYERKLYFLEAWAEDESLKFRPCRGREPLHLPESLRKSVMSIMEPGKDAEAGARLDELEEGAERLEEEARKGEEGDKKPPEEGQKPLEGGEQAQAGGQKPPPPAEPRLADLLPRLDDDARAALETALGEALRIGHFWLGVEFLLMALSRQEDGPLSELLAELKLEPGDFRGALRGLVGVRQAAADQWRQQTDLRAIGSQAFPDLAEIDPATLAADYAAGKKSKAGVTPRLMAVLRDAAGLAGEGKIAPIHLLLAAMQHPQCVAVNLLLGQMVKAGHDPRGWLAWLQQRAGGAAPGPGQEAPGPPAERGQEIPPAGQGRGDRPPQPRPPQAKGLLGQLGRDLTALAQAGELSPAIGQAARKAMGQMGEVLLKTQGNNPILLGDPGVGKTAIVEGFAWRLGAPPEVVAQHEQKPPAPQLAGKRIVDLPPAALLAGTKYRGELEERLQKVLAEVKAARGQTIVFIDEIHTILGGKAEGGLGAISDALKPALARGEFPCIGATTVAEYRRYIESDPALARRFSPVWIEEPSPEEAFEIARKVAQERLAVRHGVAYPDVVIQEAVRLAVRYLHDEFLPGKVIKLLDQAGPRVILGGSLSGRPEDQARAGGGQVTVETVRGLVAERTGIPLTRLSEDERARVTQLAGRLAERVKGQDEAIAAVAAVVKRARAGLANPRRPLGVFLFAGPTGVGKTELALALAEALFDDEKAILRLDMSEYLEKHQVARLIGSPPGYVGYEEEGQLTDWLRRHPYTIVLLDEIEKAHADVQHLFLQLFDAGRLTDGRGRLADGRNAIFIMTTNLGAREAMGFITEPITYEEKLQKAVEDYFSPEFRNRINRIVYFRPLNQAMLAAIFDKLFARVKDSFRSQGIEVDVDDALKKALCEKCLESKQGARPLERAIDDNIVAPLADRILRGEIGPGARVIVQAGGQLAVAAGPAPQAEGPARREDRPAPMADAGPVAGPPRPAAPAAPPRPAARETDDRDQQKARNEATFDRELAAIAGKLRGQGIEIEVTPEARTFLCDPFWAELPLTEALIRLVAEPLLRKIDTGELQSGDRVRVARYAHYLEFNKVEGDAP